MYCLEWWIVMCVKILQCLYIFAFLIEFLKKNWWKDSTLLGLQFFSKPNSTLCQLYLQKRKAQPLCILCFLTFPRGWIRVFRYVLYKKLRKSVDRIYRCIGKYETILQKIRRIYLGGFHKLRQQARGEGGVSKMLI